MASTLLQGSGWCLRHGKSCFLCCYSVSPVLANALAVMLASNMESLLFLASLGVLAFPGVPCYTVFDFLYFCKLFLASILLLASPMLLASLLSYMFTMWSQCDSLASIVLLLFAFLSFPASVLLLHSCVPADPVSLLWLVSSLILNKTC